MYCKNILYIAMQHVQNDNQRVSSASTHFCAQISPPMPELMVVFAQVLYHIAIEC